VARVLPLVRSFDEPEMRHRLVFGICAIAMHAVACGGGDHAVSAPPPLRPVQFDTTFGNSSLGAWENDEFGLPAFHLDDCGGCAGARDVFHQLGNGNVTAVAHSDGYVELFTAKTYYRYANHYDEATKNFAGGFGWVRDGDDTWSTLYADRPAGAIYDRVFGMGYYDKSVEHGGLRVESRIYAAPGSDEALLEHVVLTNETTSNKTVTYFDYWDVAWWLVRYDTVVTRASAYDAAHVATSYDDGRAAIEAVSDATPGDLDAPSLVADPSPKTAFVAWLGAAPDRYDTVGSAFFGSGDRQLPDAVRSGAEPFLIVGAIAGG